jgi:TolB-like protein
LESSRSPANSRQSPAGAGHEGVVRFGLYEVDLRREELRRNGIRIKLQQQPFEILRLLLTRHGQFVTREEIRSSLWPNDHFVDFEQSISTAVMKLRHALREDAASPVYIETVPRRGYRFIAPLAQQPIKQEEAQRGAIRAIAILPLQDLSATPDNHYFVDGLTDSLVTEMALRSKLRVVPRTTTERYSHLQRSIRELARELDVQAVVEGSVLRSGERIRISARLLHALEERHMWAQTFDRDLKDILLLQQEIVGAIVTSAALALRRDAPSPHTGPIQPRAYECFLKGNFLVSLRGPKSLQKALDNYQAAIDLEPEWAPPYAGLAEAYRIYDFAKHVSSADVVSRTTALTGTALRLDPHNAQAHATMGAVLAMHEWKWQEGEEQIKLALRTTSHSSQVEHLYATVLLAQGRYDEALFHSDLALSMDHSSLFLRSHRAQILLFARRYDESLQESEDILEENAEFAMGLLHYGAALVELGRAAEAVPVLERAFASSAIPVALAVIAMAHSALGNTKEARSALARLCEIRDTTGCSPVIVALGHLALNEIDKAFELFLEAAQRPDIRLPLMIQLSLVDRIRSDPRFGEIKRAIGA